ncbi:serine O-acetyltransferase [Thiogranum longum]|uniref:Serine acetyltransferase n=1 Tax=Thiogranum longum TaxID=1537524 RepID=A0A4R1HBU9_9GAMM|nr:DapH/DapD/GlmU-related protein [Thiogranum longum]TCK19467.1 serine O-acetyltransferase [Thiogranum longum]
MRLLDDLDAYAFRKGWPKWAVVLVPFVYPCSWPIIVYRFGAWVVRLKYKWLKIPLYIIYFPLKRLMEVLTTIDISEYAEIGKGFYIAHLGNIIIGHHIRIGEHASMHQGVTIGGSGKGGRFPSIGDRVYFGAGAKILGPVEIGDNVVIGANAVVNRDVADQAVVAGIPATTISDRGSDDFIHFRGKEITSESSDD